MQKLFVYTNPHYDNFSSIFVL